MVLLDEQRGVVLDVFPCFFRQEWMNVRMTANDFVQGGITKPVRGADFLCPAVSLGGIAGDDVTDSLVWTSVHVTKSVDGEGAFVVVFHAIPC